MVKFTAPAEIVAGRITCWSAIHVLNAEVQVVQTDIEVGSVVAEINLVQFRNIEDTVVTAFKDAGKVGVVVKAEQPENVESRVVSPVIELGIFTVVKEEQFKNVDPNPVKEF